MLSWRGPGHPHFGGAEINTLENVTAWAKAGHKIVWFTSTFPGGKPGETVNGVEIVRRGSQNLGVHLAAFKWYLFERHPKFDVVVDQFHGIPFFTPLYVRAPKLGFIHEVANEVWWLNPWPWPFNLFAGFLGSVLEPFIFMMYRRAAFMTVSNSTKEDLMKVGIPKNNIHVFLSGVNLKIPSPLPKKGNKPIVMFLGALSKDKGIEDAIVAFSTIHKARPMWKYLIVGVGEANYLEYLKNKCGEEGIAKHVRFVGFCKPEKKFKHLASAHVLVNPSYKEGWGLVNIEANAVGTPVVGYRVQGTKDSVRHDETGVLVPLHQPEMMAKVVVELIEDRKKYQRLSANAIEWSKQFTWVKFTKQSLALVEKMAFYRIKFPKFVGRRGRS